MVNLPVMGLLYLFPENEADDLYAKNTDDGLYLSTYGLPGIFWIYLLISSITLAFLTLAIWSPLMKVLRGEDLINYWIGVAVLALIFGLPIISLGFFFYRKELLKHKSQLTVTHRIFGLPIWQKKFQLESSSDFQVDLQLDSPNLAKIEADPSMRGFQNKGYFCLKAKTNSGEYIIDRHSRKIDLEKLGNWLAKY